MSSFSHEQDREQLITRARRALLTETRLTTDTAVDGWFDRSWITNSWFRCLAQGLRPDHRLSFDEVSTHARQRATDEYRVLLSAAMPELERLATTVAPLRYFALLTDACGTVIETAGTIDRTDRRVNAIARVGVDLSERSIGTSAIGSALGELQPVWVHRGEHFSDDTGMYSCAGAPIFSPHGHCVGSLNLAGIEVHERPELRHRVAHSAQRIENALALAVPHQLALRLGWPDDGHDSALDGLICLDADGVVVSSNTPARQMLPALQTPGPMPRHASELFALPWSALFDQADRTSPMEAPLWSGLCLHLQGLTPNHSAGSLKSRPAPRALKSIEIEMVHQAIRQCAGNVSEAARALGLSRATVYRRLKQKG